MRWCHKEFLRSKAKDLREAISAMRRKEHPSAEILRSENSGQEDGKKPRVKTQTEGLYERD